MKNTTSIRKKKLKIEKQVCKGLENILKNTLGKARRDELVDELIKAFKRAYPRLADNIEQSTQLTIMCNVYVRYYYEVLPALDEMWDEGDIVGWRQLRNPANKMEQQVDRIMSKLGFTFTAHPALKVDQRKTYDPAATNAVQESVNDLMASIKEEATDEDT